MDEPSRPESSQLTAEMKYHLLLQISEKISGTLELGEVLNQLVDTVRSVVAYDAAGIFVLKERVRLLAQDRETNLIAGMALRGFDIRSAGRDPMLSSGKGIVGYAIRTGQSVIVPDVRRDLRYVEGRKETLSEVTVPIVIHDEVIGALNLESNRLGVYTHEDVEVLQFFANAAANSIEKALLHNRLIETRRIENQLKIAREVQTSLLPDRPPDLPGYDIAAINIPTWEISGDCYDYIEFPGGQVGIAIADVSGKGVPAALIMATFRAALRAQVRNDVELSHIMQSVNRLLCESIGRSAFVTAVYGTLIPESGRFTYTNAGHNPPLLLVNAKPCTRLDCGGPALGVIDNASYDVGVVMLEPGDTLALYTDGVVEVTGREQAEFGIELLERTLRKASDRSAEETLRMVIEQTQAFSGTSIYPDDFTIVIAKRTALTGKR